MSRVSPIVQGCFKWLWQTPWVLSFMAGQPIPPNVPPLMFGLIEGKPTLMSRLASHVSWGLAKPLTRITTGGSTIPRSKTRPCEASWMLWPMVFCQPRRIRGQLWGLNGGKRKWRILSPQKPWKIEVIDHKNLQKCRFGGPKKSLYFWIKNYVSIFFSSTCSYV